MSDKAEIEKAKGVERWWSVSAKNHTLVIDVNGKGVGVKFSNFSLSLDLTSDEDKAISAGLKAHPQNGVSIYQIEGAYPDTEDGRTRRVALMRMLRKIITDGTADGRVRVKVMDQIRSLFTRQELAAAKLDTVTEDMDSLLDLAMRTKSLKGLG